MKIGSKPFIIAEMSGNHGGDLVKAKELIVAAAQCGCDAVKIQTYKPEDLCDPENNEIYEKSKIPLSWYPALFATAKENNIPLFSSVFAPWAIEFLVRFDCPAYKIASPESTRLSEETYFQLAATISKTKKPFFASTGWDDNEFIASLFPDVLFFCVAGYPAKITDTDKLRLLELRRQREPKKTGFSDHSAGIKESLAMLRMGADLIEKHFKLDDDCIDAAFSLNPSQMETLCRIAHR